jgi:SAM-dependent methyltransferase
MGGVDATTGTVDSWDQHWSEFGEAAERAPAVKYRRRLIYSLLNLPTARPAQILEIGSGQGGFALDLLRRAPQTRFVGLELSKVGVDLAGARVPSATFLQRDLCQPVADGDVPAGFAATAAVCSEVLEHVDDPALLLRHAAAYMAPGCRLVVTVPGGPMGAFDRHIGHRRHFTTSHLASVLGAAGYEVDSLYAAGFPFFNLYRRLVVLRGEALVANVSGPPSMLARGAMLAFDLLFRLNIRRWGYQVLGVARLSGGSARAGGDAGPSS